jgi:hypothetical protein
MSERWSLRKALCFLGGSVLTTLICSVGIYGAFSAWNQKRRTSDQYNILSIVQTGPEKEALKTAYLAELLGLSVDKPKNLYALDLNEAAKALLSSPLIRSAKVKRSPPNTLYIEYEARHPMCWLADYKNVAIDREGYLFPGPPFFTPKEMPQIYLGLPAFGEAADAFGRSGGRWRSALKNRYLDLALELLHTFEGSPWKKGLRIQRIDVSNAFAPSLGRREIVLFTEEEIFFRKEEKELTFCFPKILRLGTADYAQQLQNFFALRQTMVEDYRKQLASLEEGAKFAPRIIDLRVPQLAFVENQR